MLRRSILGLCCLAAWPLLPAAQTLRYDATSVRANTSGPRGTQPRMQFTPAGDFTAVNQPLRVLLNFAFRLPLHRVEGMPDWFTSERWDVTGKAPAGLVNVTPDQRTEMLRGLLEDRFALKTRMVTKDMPGMVITLARSDGRLGPGLRPSTSDCESAEAAALARVQGRPPSGRPPCALGGGSGGPLCGTGVTLAQLADGLGGVFQRHVLDQTGLTGRYDFLLTFTPDQKGGPGISFGRPCGAVTGDQPAFSTAFSEQLGLKIESRRIPVEMLVIESAERAADN